MVRQVVELADGRQVIGPPKTDAGRRTIALPPHVVPELKLHLTEWVGTDPSSLVFASPDGDALRRSNFNRRVWQPACKAAGLLGLRFHDLRHTGNTLAASTGASTKELMSSHRPRQPARRADLSARRSPGARSSLAEALLSVGRAQREPGAAPLCESRSAPMLINVRSAPQRLEHVLVLEVEVLVKAVETMGLEPTTPCLQSKCFSQLSYVPASAPTTKSIQTGVCGRARRAELRDSGCRRRDDGGR